MIHNNTSLVIKDKETIYYIRKRYEYEKNVAVYLKN